MGAGAVGGAVGWLSGLRTVRCAGVMHEIGRFTVAGVDQLWQAWGVARAACCRDGQLMGAFGLCVGLLSRPWCRRRSSTSTAPAGLRELGRGVHRRRRRYVVCWMRLVMGPPLVCCHRWSDTPVFRCGGRHVFGDGQEG